MTIGARFLALTRLATPLADQCGCFVVPRSNASIAGVGGARILAVDKKPEARPVSLRINGRYYRRSARWSGIGTMAPLLRSRGRSQWVHADTNIDCNNIEVP
jgi:hypothetical protein